MDEVNRAALDSWLKQQRRSGAGILEVERIATGNSRANWYVRVADGDRYVVRIEQGGVFGTSSADEFRFMAAARDCGCPVAPVRWIEPTGEILGQPFFVMDYLDGAVVGRDDRSMSPELAEDFVRRLDELHRTEWEPHLHADVAATDATHLAVERWYRVYRSESDVAIPLLEEGAAWLHHRAPRLDRVAIVHGDPGPGNVVHDGSRVIAFTDWEFAHLGDPREDWVYLITMRGAHTMALEEWLAMFARVAGVSVGEDDLRYWSVFNHFKGACANLTCRRVFRTTNPAPNMALIGTALHQTYVREVARLIGGGTVAGWNRH
jgi:aminoglycoside phosphotransferase (APT) family kinase protein